MSAAVELDQVSADFGTFRAVDKVSVTINAGEFFSFLGPSGCGKTTILRMISGFIAPTEGTIKIGGADMDGIRPNKRPTVLIFQNLALFPLMPVWENVSFSLEMRGVDKVTRRARAEDLLKTVDLHDAADKMINQLSGGQKQRVAIARALAVEPKVMLLDEPLSALDLKLRQHMRAELRSIQKRTNVTFIYITHDQGEALAMSDRVAVMSQGRIQQVARPEEIYNDPQNGFVASFVGENNIFEGTLISKDNRTAQFKTEFGIFTASTRAPLPAGTPLRLYLRPEHARLEPKSSSTQNQIPVTVTDISFEGHFINVLAMTDQGRSLIAEIRNDGSSTIPEIGSRHHFVFDPERAHLLADSQGAQGQ